MADTTSFKQAIDALLLKLPGVSARKVGGVDGYFVADKMFACVADKGLALRLPAAAATELQFSCEYIGPYSPGGMATTREWVQIARADPADLAKDMDLVQQSLDHVKKGRR